MRIIASAIVVLLTAGIVHADTVVHTEPTGNGILRATGITGLVVDDKTFDVTFHTNVDYRSFYVTQDPYCLGDEDGAHAAADAIAAALNTLPVKPTINLPPLDVPGEGSNVWGALRPSRVWIL